MRSMAVSVKGVESNYSSILSDDIFEIVASVLIQTWKFTIVDHVENYR